MAANYDFLSRIGTILNSGQSRVLALTGNLFDWFYLPGRDGYVPLIDYLLQSWDTPRARHFIKVVYEINGPVRLLRPEEDLPALAQAWRRLHGFAPTDQRAIERLARPWQVPEEPECAADLEPVLQRTIGNPVFALELLRQLCVASRTVRDGKPLLSRDLIILVEGADMLIPEGEIGRLAETDRRKIGICRDWFSDPGFMNGGDSVVLLAESTSRLNEELTRLPQLLDVEIPSPGTAERLAFINWFIAHQPEARRPALWSTAEELAEQTAGLSVLAIMQLLKDAAHTGCTVRPGHVFAKVEAFLKGQLGEDVVEFHKPSHRLTDVVGNRRLKRFLSERFIPRVRRTGKGSLAGAAVAGPIGSGKTFIFEAVAAELSVPVLTLKNLRSKWFGETDVIFERLRRSLEALNKVLIFMDEADTQMGGVGPDVHEAERRLTGKIQAMMSDSRLRGRVIWLLMTARIHMLSADLRRPGRAGDMIIPVLDPEGDDLRDFIRWMIEPVLPEPDATLIQRIEEETAGYYAAVFASMREELIAEADGARLDADRVLELVHDRMLAASGRARRIQALHAMLNCTHASLLPGEDPQSDRPEWARELAQMRSGGF